MSDRESLANPASLDGLLLYRMSRVLAVSGSLVVRLCEGQFGITRREWRVLALLAREEGVFSSQLAQRAQLDRARTSRALTTLVAKKLVRRNARPGDRRQISLALTDEGRALYAAIFPLVTGINQQLLSALSRLEIEALDKILIRLQLRAGEMVERADLPRADRRHGTRMRRELMNADPHATEFGRG
ncbi:MAG TPA: MarR family transcriptional regulator [Rhodoferax sp.]|nr:MarR family transcriptional regulator [Rhodoferax sp.]